MTPWPGGSITVERDAPLPPAACPYCGAPDVRTAGYDAPLRILRQRVWHYCTQCGWEAEATAGRSDGIAARAQGRG